MFIGKNKVNPQEIDYDDLEIILENDETENIGSFINNMRGYIPLENF